MAIGKRIRFFRNRKGMTQKQLGEILGFLGKTSDVRMAQYESEGSTYSTMFDMFHAWQEQAARLERGEITKEEYDQWRYKYPELDTSNHWKKTVPSQGLSDLITQALKDETN